MATQRLAKEVITPAFQASLSTVVCCRVGEKSTSKFALGKYGAEKLLGKGDMLYKDGGGTITHLQAGYVFEHDTQEIVERIKEKYA
jgi:S-DNA-T family DNA segregation ATPase FtsK/SpoIIIE